MTEERPEKLSESIMVRIAPGDMERIVAVAKATGVKPATLARMGLLEVVERLEAQAPEISPEIARAIASAAARGVDVERVLTDALEARLCADAAEGGWDLSP